MFVGGRRGVLLREVKLWLGLGTFEDAPEGPFCCTEASGAAEAETDVLLVSRAECSLFSVGVMLLLALLVNLDTCCVGLLFLTSASLLLDLGAFELDFFAD